MTWEERANALRIERNRYCDALRMLRLSADTYQQQIIGKALDLYPDTDGGRMTGKHGHYSTPRKCDCCEYETTDRDAYWQHVAACDKRASEGNS